MSMQVDNELMGDIPDVYQKIREATSNLKFNMASDLGTGSLLKHLLHQNLQAGFLSWARVPDWQQHGSLKAWIKKVLC